MLVADATVLVAGLLAVLAPMAAAAQAQLPVGAQTVSETYQDWQMVCTQPQGAKRCAINQQQTDSKSNQRVLAIELSPEGDKAEGMLALPFGLILDKGVALKIGEVDLGPVLRFKTCLPQGCIAPFSFDAKTLATLRKASSLSVTAVGTNDQPAALSVSLKGFGQALDRAAALAK
jgi:invasion protein IalB